MTVDIRKIRRAFADHEWHNKLKNLSKKEAQDIMDIAGILTPIAPLSRADELELIARSQDGDSVATEALVRSQVRSLVKLVNKLDVPDGMRSDLFQACVLAYVEEIGAHDPNRGIRLWIHALPAVRGAMMNEMLLHQYPVRVPEGSAYNESRPIARKAAEDAMVGAVYWHDPASNDEDGLTLGDVTEDIYGGPIGALPEDIDAVEELLGRLKNPNHIFILKASFGFFGELTDDEIAERVGVKRTAVVMARQRALAKLRSLVA